MLFVSATFLEIFLPLTLAGFYLTLYFSPALSIILILASSLVFYALGGAQQMFVLLASVLVNFLVSQSLAHENARTDQCRRYILLAGVTFNVLLLGYFKYTVFLLENINMLFSLTLHYTAPLFPLGISFYTFTQIAFLADCYWRKGPRKLIPSHYLLFVTYFPHLIAGPIIHWREMMPQFARIARGKHLPEEFNEDIFYRGAALFAMGLLKKVFIADKLAPVVEAGYAHVSNLSFFDAWQITLSYSFQLYFDFSGYSDMAIGMSYLIGIALPINFDSPYKSRSVREFWRRWHMTLSRWLRDYIYIPLGGNRGSQLETLRNLVLTFLVGGLWHGASWTFIIWGALHGIGCCVEQIIQSRVQFKNHLIAVVITFLFVNFSWVFFRSPDLTVAVQMVKSMITPSLSASNSKVDPGAMFYLFISGAVCWGMPTSQAIALKYKARRSPLMGGLIGIVLVLSLLSQNSSAPSPFLYFNF